MIQHSHFPNLSFPPIPTCVYMWPFYFFGALGLAIWCVNHEVLKLLATLNAQLGTGAKKYPSHRVFRLGLREAEIMKMTFEIPQEPEDRWKSGDSSGDSTVGTAGTGHHWAHEICQCSLVPVWIIFNYDIYIYIYLYELIDDNHLVREIYSRGL